MPEGDTIYRTAQALRKALAGKVVTVFETGLAPLARVDDDAPMAGRTVDRVEARGKWCLIHFSARPALNEAHATAGRSTGDGGPVVLATHMLMSGTWHIYRVGEKWWMPRSRMRVAITCGEMQAIAFNVPIAEFHTERSLARDERIAGLGPDVLSEGFDADIGVAALTKYARERPEAEVGVALLNQRVLAGLGNVYKSEVAFAAGVNPFRQIGTLSAQEIQAMADAALRYMRANVREGASGAIVTYTGQRRTTRAMNEGERLWVYGRQGEECRRCGTLIERRLQGTQARPTYWCPRCQPWIPAEGQGDTPPVGRNAKLPAVTRRRIGR